MSERTSQAIIPKDILDANKKAFKAFDIYKKTAGLIERANIAMGRKKFCHFSNKLYINEL